MTNIDNLKTLPQDEYIEKIELEIGSSFDEIDYISDYFGISKGDIIQIMILKELKEIKIELKNLRREK